MSPLVQLLVTRGMIVCDSSGVCMFHARGHMKGIKAAGVMWQIRDLTHASCNGVTADVTSVASSSSSFFSVPYEVMNSDMRAGIMMLT